MLTQSEGGTSEWINGNFMKTLSVVGAGDALLRMASLFDSLAKGTTTRLTASKTRDGIAGRVSTDIGSGFHQWEADERRSTRCGRNLNEHGLMRCDAVRSLASPSRPRCLPSSARAGAALVSTSFSKLTRKIFNCQRALIQKKAVFEL